MNAYILNLILSPEKVSTTNIYRYNPEMKERERQREMKRRKKRIQRKISLNINGAHIPKPT